MMVVQETIPLKLKWDRYIWIQNVLKCRLLHVNTTPKLTWCPAFKLTEGHEMSDNKFERWLRTPSTKRQRYIPRHEMSVMIAWVEWWCGNCLFANDSKWTWTCATVPNTSLQQWNRLPRQSNGIGILVWREIATIMKSTPEFDNDLESCQQLTLHCSIVSKMQNTKWFSRHHGHKSMLNTRSKQNFV